MTANVALSEDHLRILTVVAKSEGRTVEDLVRLAIDAYLGEKSRSRQAIEAAAFGAWKESEVLAGPSALTAEQVRVLGLVAKSEGYKLDEFVRHAVDGYLVARRRDKQLAMEAAFGLWGEGEDGLAYQERLRAEW